MNMFKRLLRPARERGQSLVELAISLTVLMWIAVGVLDLGRLYMTYVAIQNAAGEGALYAAIHPSWVDTCNPVVIGCNDPNVDNIIARARNESPGLGLVNWSEATITVETPDGVEEGEPIIVTVQFQYELLTPILSNIWPSITLTGRGEQLIFGEAM